MLNKKLTRKNLGNKRWKRKKRTRVLRGGEGDEPEIDGTMVCPPKLIHKNQKLIEDINTINTLTTTLENGKSIDNIIKTKIQEINNIFISKKYGVEDDIIEKYNNLLYIDYLNRIITSIRNEIIIINQGKHIQGDIPDYFFNNRIPIFIIEKINKENDELKQIKHNKESLKKIKQYNEDNNDMIFFQSLKTTDKIHKLINYYNPIKILDLDKSLDKKIEDFKNIKMRFGIGRIINNLFLLTYYTYNSNHDKYYIQKINLLDFVIFENLKKDIDNINDNSKKVDIINKFDFNENVKKKTIKNIRALEKKKKKQ